MALLRTPPGTKDVLPTEAAELRLIEDAARTVFHEFGYGEVITPALEYEEVLALSEEKAFQTGFRLLDEGGKVMILRPDLTTPIARLFGSRLRMGEPPHRVFSVSDIFRRNSPQRGQESEFRQAGVEMLGSSLPEADAEVLAVACRAIERAGLRDYSVGVGHVGFFKGLLDTASDDVVLKDRLTTHLVQKDLVGYRVALDEAAADGRIDADAHRALLEVPDIRGGPEVLERARAHVRDPAMGASLDHLSAVRDAVTRYGHGERLLFDLGIFRNFDYYTGIIFEIYAPGLGFTLGGGGRYDSLLASYGAPMPAVGFGLGLDRLHVALLEQGGVTMSTEPSVLLLGGLDAHVAVADALRAECVGVFALPLNTPEEALVRLAEQKDIRILVEPVEGTAGERWTVTDFRDGGVSEGTSLAKLPDVVCRAAWEHETPHEAPHEAPARGEQP